VKAVTLLLAIASTSFLDVHSVFAQGQETALEAESWCRPITTLELNGSNLSIPGGMPMKCWGAFMAIQQMATVRTDRGAEQRFCLPPTTTRLELIKVFVRYSEQHPQFGHRTFGELAAVALADAFPCPTPKR